MQVLPSRSLKTNESGFGGHESLVAVSAGKVVLPDRVKLQVTVPSELVVLLLYVYEGGVGGHSYVPEVCPPPLSEELESPPSASPCSAAVAVSCLVSPACGPGPGRTKRTTTINPIVNHHLPHLIPVRPGHTVSHNHPTLHLK